METKNPYGYPEAQGLDNVINLFIYLS